MEAISRTTAPKIHVQCCSSYTKRTLSSPELYKTVTNTFCFVQKDVTRC